MEVEGPFHHQGEEVAGEEALPLLEGAEVEEGVVEGTDLVFHYLKHFHCCFPLTVS